MENLALDIYIVICILTTWYALSMRLHDMGLKLEKLLKEKEAMDNIIKNGEIVKLNK